MNIGLLFEALNPFTFANFSSSNRPDLLAHRHIFPYLALQSHPLSSSATAPLPTLHQLFGTDSQKTSVSPNPPLNFIYPRLALSSATFHSRLKTELFKISYPDSTPATPHVHPHHPLHPYNPTLSPRLDLPGF